MKYNLIVSIIVAVLFFGVLIFLGVQNFDVFKESGKKLLSNSKSLSDFQKNAPNVETTLKKSFSHKYEAADIYGLSLNAFSNSIVGNYEFYKSPDGHMRYFYRQFDGQPYLDSVLELNSYCKNNGIPLLYIKPPCKVTDKTENEFSGYYNLRNEEDRIFDLAENAGVDVIDLQQDGYLSDDLLESFYYKTDGHSTNNSEFLIAKILCDVLSSKYGVEFPLYDQVFDKENYNLKSYPFIGNYSINTGRFFVGMDSFDILHPKFDTDMGLVIYDNNARRRGTYDEVCLNGYEDQLDDPGLYLITNYLQYPKASYTVYNYDVEGPRLLIIADSSMLATSSFLSLTASEITIIDPRQGNNKYLAANALACGDYDSVILGGISVQYFSSEFRSIISVPDVQEKSRVPKMGHYGIKVEYCNGEKQNDRTKISLDSEEDTFTLSGWAVDAGAEDALSGVYILAGDKVIKCNYGLESKALFDYYNNSNYKNCGFRVSLSSSFLYDENGDMYDSISIVGVSKDGTYKYEPIEFPLIIR